ncbi:MAG: hypothetical protein CRN43_07250 [Candidatus Nephrothrix sp. EaCA]|nr:MAG: hypothetical protein CRN43_07250 [Candidatus Nephrothrix sp. EaCA]
MKTALIILVLLPALVFAQEEEKKEPEPFGQEGDFTFDTDRPFKLLELDEKTEEPVAAKKKKPKKKVFYGIKTKKKFAAKGNGKSRVIELFFVLKKHDPPKGFVRDYYWYDYRRRELRRTPPSQFNAKYGVLAHGPYKKMMGDQVLAEGIFYKGTKHGRWTTLSANNILTDKEKYYKGWPKESIITYYDPDERKKLKEVIPIEYGEREGYYYLLHENGKIAVMGEYRWDRKVGSWHEYYENGKRKKILEYPENAFEKVLKPAVRSEWDESGKEVYSSTKKK